MTKYSLKMTGPYNEVGNAMATFLGENEQARKVLFGELKPEVSRSQMVPSASELTPENLIAVVDYAVDGPLIVENIAKFEDLFPSTEFATLVLS